MSKNKEDWKDVVEMCKSMTDDLSSLPDAASNFAESVEDTILGIQEWIEEKEFVTPKQISALENIQKGISNWL